MLQKTLTSRMARWISLLILLLISILTIGALSYFENQLQRTVSRQQQAMLNSLASGIDRQLDTSRQLIDGISQSAFAKVFSSTYNAEQFIELNPGLQQIFRHGVHLFDLNGKLLASGSRPPQLPFQQLPPELLANLLDHKRPYIAPPFSVSRLQLMMIIAPVLDADQRVVGLVAGTDYLFSEHLLGRLADIRLGDSGYVYLFSRKGVLLSHPDPQLLMQTPPLPEPLLVAAEHGFEGSKVAQVEHAETLVSFKQLSKIDWVLAANYPTEEAFEPIFQARRLAISIISLVTILTLLAVWLLSRQLAAPLELLTEQVRAVGRGARVRLKLPGGSPSEVTTLGEAFNNLLADLQQHNRKIQEQQSFMESLLQNTAIACFALDPQHRVLLWNRACEQLTGIPATELIGSDGHWRAFYPQQRPCLADVVLAPSLVALDELYENASPSPLAPGGFQAEGWFQGLGGQDRYLLSNAAPVLGQDGECLAVIQTLEDITELRRSHEQMDRTLSLLNATLEATADGIVVEDLGGQVSRYNNRAVEMWQLEDQLQQSHDPHFLGQQIAQQLKDPAGYQVRIKEIFHQPHEETFDIIEFKDGRCFERSSKPQLLNGTIIGRVWSFRDITEQRQLENNLRHAQKMEAVGQLAGGIAHDFNNLLTIINGYSEVLVSTLKDTDDEKSYAELILQAGLRAADLTGQLLAFSRRQLMRPQVIDLNRLIEKNRTLLRHLLREDMQLTLALGDKLAAVKVDPNQMEQILINLAVNARDAMPSGGRLLISTASTQIDAEFIDKNPGATTGEYLRLTVADNGRGMSEEIKARIFEPFFTTKELGKGTGLGLATVYGIVKQSNGYISVDSSPERGTSFSIYLPSCNEQPGEAVTAAALQPGSGRILVVENEPDLLQLAVASLQKQGYQARGVACSADAFRLFAEGSAFDLLLSDIVMPDMDGVTLARQLREIDHTLKVLLMTGYVEHQSAADDTACPFPILQKPFLPEDLVRQVQQTLQAG